MAGKGKRVGRATPPKSLNGESTGNHMWWWIGGAGALIVIAVAVIWFTAGPRVLGILTAPEGSGGEEIEPGETYVATIFTEKGDIVVALDAGAAPKTVDNFVSLAREGFYDGLTFHRVVPGFVIQGGDPLGDGTGGPGYTVPAEIELEHVKGAIAMARKPDEANPERASSGSQFYITLDETPHLDGDYTVFGQVVEGMEIVESIAEGDLIESISIEEG